MHPVLSPTSVQNHDESPPAFNLGIVWQSPLREFGTSLRYFFTGPKPQKETEPRLERAFRVDWVRDSLPGRAFTASSLWHIAAVLILILPIWGFLPQPEHTLPPLQIEITYVPAQDLPPISLHSSRSRPSSPQKPSEEPNQAGRSVRRGCLSSSPDNSFDSRRGYASAPNLDSARCTKNSAQDRCAIAEYGPMGDS